MSEKEIKDMTDKELGDEFDRLAGEGAYHFMGEIFDECTSRLAALQAENEKLKQRVKELESSAVCVSAYEEEVDSPEDIRELKQWIKKYEGIAIENGKLKSDKRELVKKVETLKNMSTVEMMCENKSVEQHVTEWEKRCLKAEEELSDLHVRYAALCALCGTGRSEIERLERRDEVWREKKRILENDLAKAWVDKRELVEAIAGLFRDSDCSVNWEKAMAVIAKHIEK